MADSTLYQVILLHLEIKHLKCNVYILRKYNIWDDFRLSKS